MKKIAALLMALALVACDGDDTTGTSSGTTSTSGSGGAGTGGSTGDGGAGGAGGGGTGGGGTGGAGGGSAAACPAETICLAVKPVTPGEPISPGRVGVVWFQLSDDGPDPEPVLGYDAAFDPDAARIEIPISAITTPPEELMLCVRDCDDEAQCPCLSEEKVGISLVVVSSDADGDGQLAVEEAINPHGLGFMAIGYSEIEQVPAPAALAGKFPEGIDLGVRPYRLMNDGTFDDMYRAPDGEVFDLNICPGPGDNCDMPRPNLN